MASILCLLLLIFHTIPVRCLDPLFIRMHQPVLFDSISFPVIRPEHFLLHFKIFAAYRHDILYIFYIPLINSEII